ncbi:coiled-coil domain-containing protein [Thiomicrorhabdus indica]|uniref:coiled-coil domain-containing protein n=1 Tax=Thiomicrorhabdus indica TaxID=2267253 RepID=UPI002AA6CDF6|nr:coiled-coil domain-containing protein [Thiomicrorhabdus indica]
MSIVSFDTLEFVKELESHGFSSEQAEALAKTQKRAFEQALETQLATKSDIHVLKSDVNEVKSEIRLIKWMLALVIVVTVIPVLKDIFS